MTDKARALTMASIAKIPRTKEANKQRAAQKRQTRHLRGGYAAMTPEQLQAAGERAEAKAKRTREKARKEAERLAFLLANPKTAHPRQVDHQAEKQPQNKD